MSLVNAIVDPVNLVSAAVAILTFATFVTLAAPALKGDKLSSRMKSVQNRRDELRRRSRINLAKESSSSTLRHTDAGVYRNILDKLQIQKLLEDPKLIDKLAEAGFRGPRPITTFYFFRFVMPFILAVVAAIYLFAINDFGLPPNQRFLAIFFAFFMGFYAPAIYVSNIAAKRRTSVVGAFPTRSICC
jgi:tight adherence protein C